MRLFTFVFALTFPSLLNASICDRPIEDVDRTMTREQVMAAWSGRGLELEDPSRSLPRAVQRRYAALIRSGREEEAARLLSGVLKYGIPRSNEVNPSTLRSLYWERLDQFIIEARYMNQTPQVPGRASKNALWSLWPMIEERLAACEAPGDDRALQCSNKPGEVLITMGGEPYMSDPRSPGRGREQYRCTYSLHATYTEVKEKLLFTP